MNDDNTLVTKSWRSYRKLIMAILEGAPENIIVGFLAEAKAYAVFGLENSLTLDSAIEDSKNYLLYYQCGRCVLIKKDSVLGKQIRFGNKKKKEEKK